MCLCSSLLGKPQIVGISYYLSTKSIILLAYINCKHVELFVNTGLCRFGATCALRTQIERIVC